MTQFVCFDSTKPDPKPVLGWYDTDLVTYPNLPPSENLMVLTPAQWGARMTKIWAVSEGVLTAVATNPLLPLIPTST